MNMTDLTITTMVCVYTYMDINHTHICICVHMYLYNISTLALLKEPRILPEHLPCSCAAHCFHGCYLSCSTSTCACGRGGCIVNFLLSALKQQQSLKEATLRSEPQMTSLSEGHDPSEWLFCQFLDCLR